MASFSAAAFDVDAFDVDAFDIEAAAADTRRAINARRRRRCAILLFRRFRLR